MGDEEDNDHIKEIDNGHNDYDDHGNSNSDGSDDNGNNGEENGDDRDGTGTGMTRMAGRMARTRMMETRVPAQ